MTDLERLEQDVLGAARRYLSPTPSDRVRVQSALSRGDAWWQPASLRPSWVRRATRSFGVGVTLGLVLGALVGYGASHVSDLLHARQRSAERARAEATGRAAGNEAAGNEAVANEIARPALPPSEPAAARAPGGASEPASNVTEGELVANEREHAHSLPVGARVTGSTGKKAVARVNSRSNDQRSSLAEELSLLSRARRALNRDQANLALGMVMSLDERFPNGVLMEEREATRILCLCALARTDEARGRAQRFLLLHAASVYAERVRGSCAGGQ